MMKSRLLRSSRRWSEREVHVRVGRAVRSQCVLTTIVNEKVLDTLRGNRCPFPVNLFLLGNRSGCNESQDSCAVASYGAFHLTTSV